ncbi:MAG: toxin-antitoxin system HicB family antitoxin [Kiritimatiellia bacterium]|jgi:predicted HicB family RNase H-like nuclease|nr:toxin-antitoxin system HicB family antitoxin [Kiritimatiellia bacterium]MDP6810151.1 toxin-antitoxin system HicB family antitoxin [Kiritimatiellia bacterium]MDP7023631.1 toxin-antitoxin system HicB family antitoxin [Kiritimatiellia bacterium]
MKQSDRYLKIVEWSKEDQCYVGTCPGLMLGGIHGDNEAKVYKDLCQTVEEWIDIYQEDGEPLPAATAGKEYSGKFVVRVGKELHKALAVDALRYGESLNSFCVHVLREERAQYGKNERQQRISGRARPSRKR